MQTVQEINSLNMKLNINYICGVIVVIISCVIGFVHPGNAEGYRIGVGRADCTGPPVEILFVSIKVNNKYCSSVICFMSISF